MKGRTSVNKASKTRSMKSLKAVPKATTSYTSKRNIGSEKCSGFNIKVKR